MWLTIKLFIYALGPLSALLFMHEIVYVKRAHPPPLWSSLTAIFMDKRKKVASWYADDELTSAFGRAGFSTKLSAWQYKFYRDGLFILVTLVLHLRFLVLQQYPLKPMIIVFLLYMLSLTGKAFSPGRMLLTMLGKERQSQKNDEIIDLYMLLSNDYQAETSKHYQSVFAKLKEYRAFTKALRSDVDMLLNEYPVVGNQAFEAFGERVGTKEAKTLAGLLEKINRSNPEMAVDLLEKNYDTFLDYRRQRRKKRLKANGYVGHTVVFLAIIAVIYFVNIATNAYKNVLMDSVY